MLLLEGFTYNRLEERREKKKNTRRVTNRRSSRKQLVDGTAHREDLVWAGLAQGLSAAGLLVQAIE